MTTIMLPLLFITTMASLQQLASSFIPDALFGVASPNSIFHTKMTERAVIRHAIHYFNDQSTMDPVRLNELKYDDDPDEDDVFKAAYGDTADTSSFNDVIEEFQDACASIDKDKTTKKNPKWHFDSERFEDGHKNLIDEVNGIIRFIKAAEYSTARERLGRIFHPLQDFYTHSNWVELGKKNIMSQLGVEGQSIPIRIAGSDEQTCKDCVRNFKQRFRSTLLKLTLVAPIGFKAAGGSASNIFECIDNVILKDAITSGYSVNQKDDEGNAINKPEGVGKCSHGGTLDGSSNKFAKGGMNKDAEYSLFAPHDYLHKDAAALAENATVHFLSHIRTKLNDDAKWAQFLQLSPGPSLAFVIDVCSSMQRYVEGVRKKILESVRMSAINSQSARVYIVVTFTDKQVNDPIIAQSDTDMETILEEQITFQEKCGTTRKIYEAVEKASLKSHLGGYIYAMTNGMPGDSHLRPWIENTINDKRLVFDLLLADTLLSRQRRTGDTKANATTGSKRLSDATLKDYRDLLQFNGGGIQYVRRDSLDEVIDFSSQFSPRKAVILVAHDNKDRGFRFPVDETIKELEVTISGTGGEHPPDLSLTDPEGTKTMKHDSVEADSSTAAVSHFHKISVPDPAAGKWSANVKVMDSSNHYTLVVKAVSTLKLKTKFLQHDEDEEADHPGTHDIGRTRPRAGTEYLLEIKPDRRNTNMVPIFVQLRDSQWNSIAQTTISKSQYHSKGYYATIKMPDKPFYIRIFGFDEHGHQFIRTSPKATEPSNIAIEAPESPKRLRDADRKYKLDFMVTNFGETGLFSISTFDSKSSVVSWSPKGIIIGKDKTVKGSVTIQIPEDRLLVTELVLYANGGTKLKSNSLTKHIAIA